MENKVTHRWRCMNCWQMTDSEICVYCGKQSCTNTKQNQKSFKKSEHMEEFTKTSAENKQIFSSETLDKNLKSAIFAINSSAHDEFKKIKKILSVLSGIIISLIFITFVLCFKTKMQIKGLTKTNNELNNIVNFQSEEIVALQKEFSKNNTVKYVAHTVKAGETLVTICNDYNINYAANKNIILSFNGIENPNQLAVGQMLILPKIDNCD